MVLEDAHQAVTATKRMFTAVRAGVVATTELRAALQQTRVLLAAGAAFQTAAAELIAARERHGDGGAEVLAVSAGLTQSEAHSQVKTAQVLRKVPELRDAVQTGEVSSANARRLADVITKTSADGGLHRWLRMIGHDGRSHHKQPSGGGSYYGGKAEF